MQQHEIRANLREPEGVRRTVFEGVEHLVVPVVMIVDGVLNGALVTQAEYGKHVEAWNNRPVPVLHPERDGMPVSANQPDIIEKNTIGQIFNARVDDGKLKAEAWINTDKAKRLGYTNLLNDLEAGQTIEVSTGYFADSVAEVGTFNGAEYNEIHTNIRPDHLALLPGEVGACSVQDGCGTRVNNERGVKMKVQEAFNTLAKAIPGLQANCECNPEEQSMTDTLKEQAEALKANGTISAKQFQSLAEMDDDQLNMVRALVDALSQTGGQANEDEPEEPEEMAYEKPEDQVQTQSAVDPAKVDELVANKVAEHLRRHSVTERLVKNDRCPFDADELKAMSVEHLEKLEKSIRPADYSGAGGFAANSDAVDTQAKPLGLSGGVLNRKRKEA